MPKKQTIQEIKNTLIPIDHETFMVTVDGFAIVLTEATSYQGYEGDIYYQAVFSKEDYLEGTLDGQSLDGGSCECETLDEAIDFFYDLIPNMQNQDNIKLNQKELSQEIYHKALGCEQAVTLAIPSEHNQAWLDFSDPKGAVVKITLETINAEEEITQKEFKTNIFGKLDIEKKEDPITFKGVSNFNLFKIFSYDKSTVALITEASLKSVVSQYMEELDIDSVVMLQRGIARIILPQINSLTAMVGGLNLNNIESEKPVKKVDLKNDLKVYETPSNIHSAIMESMQLSAYMAIVTNQFASKIFSTIQATQKKKDIFVEVTGFHNNGIKIYSMGDAYIQSYITEYIEWINYGILKQHGLNVGAEWYENRIEESTKEQSSKFHEAVFYDENGFEDSKLVDIFEYMERIAVQAKSENISILSSFLKTTREGEFKKIIGREFKGKELTFFDPQIGSAENFFSASKEIGLEEVKIWGTELREDISYPDDRIKAISGINTALMSENMSKVFFDGKMDSGVKSMITYNNPPYSQDDDILKETIKMYKNGTLVSGLFPTKTLNFLKNNLDDAVIIEVNRELTGYTDPSTPEKFLVVVGKKFSGEAENRENGFENSNDGVFNHIRRSIKELKLSSNNWEDLSKMLATHLISGSNKIGYQVYKNIEYHHGKDFSNIPLVKHLEDELSMAKSFFKNVDLFKEIAEQPSVLKNIQALTSPLQVAKTQKVFVDTRFYSEVGDYEKFAFDDVVSNAPLLIYYAKTSPSILGIIEDIAKEKGVSLPINKESLDTSMFVLGERFEGKKVTVATDKLGMMKFNFFPTLFDLKNEKQKKILEDVIIDIYKDNSKKLSAIEIKQLEYTLSVSDAMTTKTERVITQNGESEFSVGSKECLVLIDAFGNDINKLNISNFDLYNKLEEKELFDLHDYIDVVSLKQENKQKIIKGFMELIESSTIPMLQVNSKMGESAFLELIDNTYNRIKDGEDVYGVGREVFKNIDAEKTIRAFFNTKGLSNIDTPLYPIFEEFFSKEFKTDTKEGRKKLKTYLKSLDEVYQKNTHTFFGRTLSENLSALHTFVNEYAKKNNGSNDEVAERMNNAEEKIRLSLSDIEKFNKEIHSILDRLSLTIFVTYADMKDKMTKIDTMNLSDVSKMEYHAKVYDNIFTKFEKSVASLMPHQISEPENFLETGKRTNFMLKAMRTGKTLGFIFSGLLKMMSEKQDMELYVQSANIKDIASQAVRHFPILLPVLSVFSDSKYHQFNEDMSYDTLYHTSAVSYPLGLNGLGEEIVGGGEEIKRLKETFSKDMEQIKSATQKKYPNGVTVEELLKDYKDSPFIGLLERAKSEICSG